MVGGYRQSTSGPVVLQDCLQVDANMTVYEREPMKMARFNAPLALVRDRFLLALGGQTSRNALTKACECFDTYLNHWFNIAPLPTQTINVSAVVMNDRFVYLMPGANRENQLGSSSLLINYLDTGATANFAGDKNTREYGLPIARQKWVQIEVANAEFFKTQPVAGLQLNATEMLIFGGENLKTYTLDMREVQGVSRQGTVKPCKLGMNQRGRFANSSDFIARAFGPFIYAIDAREMQLHVYSTKDKNWNAQALSELGIAS